MPDVLHWLGITRIDRFVSMSNMKHDAIAGAGIAIGELRRRSRRNWCRQMRASNSKQRKRPAISARAEAAPTEDDLTRTVGRDLKDF